MLTIKRVSININNEIILLILLLLALSIVSIPPKFFLPDKLKLAENDFLSQRSYTQSGR